MKASAGYVVVSPSVPASVTSSGLYGVQLQIADGMVFLHVCFPIDLNVSIICLCSEPMQVIH